MKQNIFQKTFLELENIANLDNKILISYSGGKDSLIVLDLCSKIFKQVICFFMYLVPGIQICEQQIKYAEDRYKVQIIQYPHWLISHLLRNGIYCNPGFKNDDLPYLKPKDIYAIARQDTGFWPVATGMKKSDTLWRRRTSHRKRPAY